VTFYWDVDVASNLLYSLLVKFLSWKMRRAGLKGLLVLFETLDGRRFGCQPTQLVPTADGFATSERCDLSELQRANAETLNPRDSAEKSPNQ